MTPIETVKKLIISLELPYFSVKNNNQLLYRQTKDLKPEAAAEDLENFLTDLTYNYVDVTLSGKSFEGKSAGGNLKADFTHRVKLNGAGSITGVKEPAAGQTIDLMQQIAQLKADLVEADWKAKFETLEKRLDEGKNPMQEMALMALLNMFGANTGIAASQAPIINGHQEEAPPITTDDKTALKNAIKKLAAADKNYINTLVMIADFATNKPAMYESFKPMLKSQI